MSYGSASPPPAAGSSGSKAFHTILAGRKCYRVSKDKNEVVWPPHLEAALMEGLEKYTPAESKSPRGLSRFPNRNKFIAQYILHKTGQIRTAKQVGSRIQQLRDTSAGKNIMKAISDRHYEMMHPSRQSPSEQDAQAAGVPALTFSGSGASAMSPSNPPVVQVYISVPPPLSPSPPSTATWPGQPQPQAARRTTEVSVLQNTYQFVEPRLLRTIDPQVTFASSSPLPLVSRCNVYCEATIAHVGAPVTMDVHPLPRADEGGASGYLHYTNLAPGYWETLCSCDDLSPYIVEQEITKPPSPIDPTLKPATVMVIQYRFIPSVSGQSRPLSPFSLDAEFDYDADSGSDIFPLFPSQMSTGSESPLPSDRSSSPSYSTPSGFASQPLSPIGWVPGQADQWTAFGSASSAPAHMQQFPTSAYPGFGVQQHQQQHQHHPHPSHQSMYHPGPHQGHQQPSPPGQFLGPPSF